MNYKLNSITRCLGITTLAVALSYPALAEEVEKESATLEHIEVTSTKRVQSIKDIPMSIQAISGDMIQNESLGNLADLSNSVPNLIITETMATTNINIRGMGSGVDRSFEQSVSMFIDGVYMPRSRQYRAPFMDVERVEVLRGTQAVLFGLNSTAGAISVISKKSTPDDDLSASIKFNHEFESNETSFEGVIGGGVSDTLGLRLAVQTLESDGFGINTFDNSNVGAKDQTIIRLSSVWQPSDDLTVSAKVETAEFDVKGNTFTTVTEKGVYTYDTNTDGSILNFFDPAQSNTGTFSPFSNARTEAGLDHESTNAVVDIAYDMNGYTLSAIVGYSEYDYVHSVDLDGMPAPVLDNILTEEYDQSSFEVRLSSPVNDNFSYIVGAYYQTANLVNVNPHILSLNAILPAAYFPILGLPDPAVNDVYEWIESGLDQTTDAFSVFANATWAINDSLNLIFGARYITEDKVHDRVGNNYRASQPKDAYTDFNWVDSGTGTIFTATFDGEHGDITSDNFMPEAMLQWTVDSDSMAYAKIGTSAKSGGFASSLQIQDIDSFNYDDETALGYELGYKTSFADGMADANIALFRTEFKDLQVNTFNDLGIPIIDNASDAVTQGLEIELRWMINDYLLTGISASYLDATYVGFTEAPCNSTDIPMDNGLCDKSGDTMPFAPEFSGQVFLDFIYPISDDIELTVGANVQFSSEYFTEGSLEEFAKQEGYEKVNARIGIKSADDIWSVSIIGKNLTDEVTLGSYQPFLTKLTNLDAPMTVNLQLVYNFEL